MNIDRWLAVLGLLVGLTGIVLAYRFYRKTIRTKLLGIGFTDSIPLTLPFPEISSLYEGQKIDAASRIYILLWNKGTSAIEMDDFVEPIRVQATKPILSLVIHDKDAAASVSIEKDHSVFVQLLRPGEAIILRLDAAGDDHKGDLSVKMKTSDTSTILGRNSRLYWADLLSSGPIIGFAVLFIGISLIEFENVFGGGWLFLSLYVAFLLVAALLANVAVGRMAQRLLLATAYPVASKFFSIQQRAWLLHLNIERAGKSARDIANYFTGTRPTGD